MHVLVREVIFVDLALAQLAALGATVASVLEFHEGDLEVYLIAFAFTLLGAAIFAFTRRARGYLSQEAVVGITYAVGSAALVLLLTRAPHGAEHMKNVLVGSLLLTTWSQVWKMAVAYLAIGMLQILFARRFIMISWTPNQAEERISRLAWWDFAFYSLFGIVITLSVQVAGILLVFSFLIVPAVITRLFSQRMTPRLVIGWLISLLASILGLAASWGWDLPTGAAIVVAFGLLLVSAGIVRAFSQFAGPE
jgi:zinc/manganese transport system permease protein